MFSRRLQRINKLISSYPLNLSKQHLNILRKISNNPPPTNAEAYPFSPNLVATFPRQNPQHPRAHKSTARKSKRSFRFPRKSLDGGNRGSNPSAGGASLIIRENAATHPRRRAGLRWTRRSPWRRKIKWAAEGAANGVRGGGLISS